MYIHAMFHGLSDHMMTLTHLRRTYTYSSSSQSVVLKPGTRTRTQLSHICSCCYKYDFHSTRFGSSCIGFLSRSLCFLRLSWLYVFFHIRPIQSVYHVRTRRTAVAEHNIHSVGVAAAAAASQCVAFREKCLSDPTNTLNMPATVPFILFIIYVLSVFLSLREKRQRSPIH